MEGAVETNKPSLLSAIDVLLVNLLCTIYPGGEGFTLIFTLDSYGSRDRVWFRVSPPLNRVLFLPLLAV